MNFRTARHTNNLDGLIDFYIEILHLEVLEEFENHENYNGIFLGKKNHSWHLEFTASKEKAHHTFDDDDILVFYPLTNNEYKQIISSIEKRNVKQFTPKNLTGKQTEYKFRIPTDTILSSANKK